MPDTMINRLCAPLLVLGASVLVFAVAWLMLDPSRLSDGHALVLAAQITGAIGLGFSFVLLWLAARQARA